jgi:pimeloyl-ACP methyl ester carboxylesterase
MSEMEKPISQLQEGHMTRVYWTISLLIFSLSFFGCEVANTDPDYSKTPIFFVHGYGGDGKRWGPIISNLTKSGYPASFLRPIRLWPSNGSNIMAADKQIAPAIEAFLKDVNEFIAQNHPDIPQKTKVDLVSHSMGGLSSRWYTAKVRPDRVRKWISLAGANHGTNDVCPPRFVSPGADDLCPAFAKNPKESLIQYELNGKPYAADVDETPYGLGVDSPGVNSILPDDIRSILYISIRTSPDKWIDPETSPILDGAGGIRVEIPEGVKAVETSPGNILMSSGIGHDRMPADSDTMKLVSIILGLNYETMSITGTRPTTFATAVGSIVNSIGLDQNTLSTQKRPDVVLPSV